VLAVAFATFAVTLYSKRVAYYDLKVKTENELNQKIAEKQTEIDNLTAERNQLKTDLTAAETKRDQYKADAEKFAKEKADAVVAAEMDKNRADVAVEAQKLLATQVETMRQELESTRKVVVALKERETVLRANEAELKKERDALKNDVNRARQDLAELHRDRKQIAAELANAEYVIASLIKAGIDVYKYVGAVALGTVPDVRTKVVDVRPATGHVALGAGKDSGIREGFIFLIHRGDQYVGKVRVTTVWNNFSGGTVLERKKPIQPGDDAMTDTVPSP
jgi:hypothetical protein